MWNPIDFSDKRYMINEKGQIFNKVSGKYLNPSIFSNGYKVVTLTDTEHNRKKFFLHRLVASSFLPNPENYPIVMHLDNNPLNCDVQNLKWGTYSENNAQAIRDGLNKAPDHRKFYTVYNDDSDIEYTCLGIKEVINLLEYGTVSSIRNYIFRKSKITQGPFKGWKIKLKN